MPINKDIKLNYIKSGKVGSLLEFIGITKINFAPLASIRNRRSTKENKENPHSYLLTQFDRESYESSLPHISKLSVHRLKKHQDVLPSTRFCNSLVFY